MRVVELAAAVALAAGGVRSLVVWARRGFDGTDVREHLWFAAFVTGRAGLWFAFAGLFALYAASDARGRAAIDELGELRWYALVPLVLAALQVGAGHLLGRAEPPDREDPTRRP